MNITKIYDYRYAYDQHFFLIGVDGETTEQELIEYDHTIRDIPAMICHAQCVLYPDIWQVNLGSGTRSNEAVISFLLENRKKVFMEFNPVLI